MAEMVPVEFWEWAIPQVKQEYPNIIFIAEVYNPHEYKNYLFRGKFDFLYDKVGLYDTLRNVACGYDSATAITRSWQSLGGIEKRMLNFLENHDEQRIASDFFAGDPRKGVPALIVSACMNTNPMMIYFGQEFGEMGMDSEGFSGRDGRTTIFDYWSVDTIRRWRNEGKFDGKMLTEEQKHLYAIYQRVLTLCNEEQAISNGVFNPFPPSFFLPLCSITFRRPGRNGQNGKSPGAFAAPGAGSGLNADRDGDRTAAPGRSSSRCRRRRWARYRCRN